MGRFVLALLAGLGLAVALWGAAAWWVLSDPEVERWVAALRGQSAEAEAAAPASTPPEQHQGPVGPVRQLLPVEGPFVTFTARDEELGEVLPRLSQDFAMRFELPPGADPDLAEHKVTLDLKARNGLEAALQVARQTGLGFSAHTGLFMFHRAGLPFQAYALVPGGAVALSDVVPRARLFRGGGSEDGEAKVVNLQFLSDGGERPLRLESAGQEIELSSIPILPQQLKQLIAPLPFYEIPGDWIGRTVTVSGDFQGDVISPPFTVSTAFREGASGQARGIRLKVLSVESERTRDDRIIMTFTVEVKRSQEALARQDVRTMVWVRDRSGDRLPVDDLGREQGDAAQPEATSDGGQAHRLTFELTLYLPFSPKPTPGSTSRVTLRPGADLTNPTLLQRSGQLEFEYITKHPIYGSYRMENVTLSPRE